MDRRRCFISAAYGENLDVLQRVLDQNGVAWQWAEAMPMGKPIVDSIIDAIRKSDFVVGILSGKAPNPNVMLELGMAVGRDLPLLVLATEKNAIPFDMGAFSHFETDLQNEELLSFQLDLFLRSLTTKQDSKRAFTLRPRRASAEVKDQPAPALFGSALEQIVAAAIQRAGGRVTIPSRSGRHITPDLLMWLPQQDKDLFNPAAVEVKTRIAADDLPALQATLAEFVRASSMGCGLIVINSVNLEKRLARLLPIPNTFVIGLPEFKSKLEKSDLGSWLRRERNRLAHGVR